VRDELERKVIEREAIKPYSVPHKPYTEAWPEKKKPDLQKLLGQVEREPKDILEELASEQ
jgi:hypothetical protein